MRNTLILIFVSLTLIGCGPKDYDDCILQNLKGVSNDDAIWAIKNSCREKFPYPDSSDKKTVKKES